MLYVHFLVGEILITSCLSYKHWKKNFFLRFERFGVLLCTDCLLVTGKNYRKMWTLPLKIVIKVDASGSDKQEI